MRPSGSRAQDRRPVDRAKSPGTLGRVRPGSQRAGCRSADGSRRPVHRSKGNVPVRRPRCDLEGSGSHTDVPTPVDTQSDREEQSAEDEDAHDGVSDVDLLVAGVFTAQLRYQRREQNEDGRDKGKCQGGQDRDSRSDRSILGPANYDPPIGSDIAESVASQSRLFRASRTQRYIVAAMA